VVSRYSPTEDVWQDFPIEDSFERNSCAVVAFQGELWILGGGGREFASQPTNNQVVIFDPVTGIARPGPVMNSRRGSFSAAVVDGRIVAAGGQTLQPPVVVGTSEAFDPLTGSWESIANITIPVHSTGGAEFEGNFYTMLGSTVVDSITNIGQVQVLEIPDQ